MFHSWIGVESSIVASKVVEFAMLVLALSRLLVLGLS